MHFFKTLSPQKQKLCQKFFLFTCLAAFSCVFSYYILDLPLAHFVSLLSTSIFDLGKKQYGLAVAITATFYSIVLLMFCLYIALRFFQKASDYAAMIGVLSLGVAVAFFAKSVMQDFFLKRLPLRAPDFYSSFPSGHMMIFTCLLVLVTFYYARLRWLCYSLLVILAFLMIFCGYHYLSEIIAGAYLGALIAVMMRYVFNVNSFGV